MKVYEYRAGKVRMKRLEDYALASKNYRVMKDFYNLMFSISFVSIVLSVVIALSVILVLFYKFSSLFAVVINVFAVFVSWRLLSFFWVRYKRNLSRVRIK